MDGYVVETQVRGWILTNPIFTSYYRNSEVVCVEGPAAELLEHLHHVPDGQGDVLLVQHAQGRGDVQGEQVQGLHRQVHAEGQGHELRRLHCARLVRLDGTRWMEYQTKPICQPDESFCIYPQV